MCKLGTYINRLGVVFLLSEEAKKIMYHQIRIQKWDIVKT